MKLLKALIPRVSKRAHAPVLTEGEVAAAIRRFRSLEPLCDIEACKTNDGFGASLSFRTAKHVSSFGLGSVEIGLRTAALEFKGIGDVADWSWSDAIAPFVKQHRGHLLVQAGRTERTATTLSTGGDVELGSQGGISAAIANAHLKVGHKRTRRRDSLREHASNVAVTRTIPKALVEIEGVRSPFTMRLMAPERHHLAYYNSDLVRQSFIKVPEPASLELSSVQVQLRLPVVPEWQEELVHSLSIQGASGAWAPLLEDRNKQILSELLLSKFLRRMHRPARLWPRSRAKPK